MESLEGKLQQLRRPTVRPDTRRSNPANAHLLLMVSLLLVSTLLVLHSQFTIETRTSSVDRHLHHHHTTTHEQNVQLRQSEENSSETDDDRDEDDDDATPGQELIPIETAKEATIATPTPVHSITIDTTVSPQARELPQYAAHNSFYHQRSYQCKPTGRVSYTWPTVELPNGTRLASDGGFRVQELLRGGKSVPAAAQVGVSGGKIEYGPWSMGYPNLLTEDHKKWFTTFQIAEWRRSTGCAQEPDRLNFCEQSYIQGSFSLKESVSVSDSGYGHDCGPNGNVDTLMRNGGARTVSRDVETLYWAVIPATWTFQHWMENTLPKIAAVLEFVPDFMLWQNVSAVQELLLDRYPIIKEVYSHMGWDVFDERINAIHAEKLVYSCVVPPLHPYLWQQAQQHVLRVTPLPMAQRNKIVYCKRNPQRIENAGRLVNNDDAVMQALKEWEGKGFTVDVFDHTLHPTIHQLLAYFADTRLLVGPHGGCLTNVVFLGCNSAVIELFPLVGGIHPPVGHPAMMMYMQSTFLEQHYFMLPVSTPDQMGNFDVPIEEFKQILSAALALT